MKHDDGAIVMHRHRKILALAISIGLYSSSAGLATAMDSGCSDTNSKISVAGDSITNAYWPAFQEIAPPNWDSSKVADGGLRAPQFNGEEEKDGVVGDRTAMLIEVQTDTAILLLGTNDSLLDSTNADHSVAFTRYAESMRSILDRLHSSGVSVILGLPTPLRPVSDRLTVGEDRLAVLYRPWLRLEAEARGLAVVDFFEIFVSRPDWEDFFPDGIHPHGEGGPELMAAEVRAVVCAVQVPEPGRMTLALTAIGTVASVLALRKNEKRASTSCVFNHRDPR